MNYGSAAGAYRKSAVLNASPEMLVVLMYEGAIRELERSQRELAMAGRERSAHAGESMSKAIAIIGELRSSLDFEKGGEVTQQLDKLYDFCLEQIYEANIERKPEPIAAAIRVMKTLKEAWDAVAQP